MTPDHATISLSSTTASSDYLPSLSESLPYGCEKEKAIRRMVPVIIWLQQNIHRNPKLEEIAAFMGLSPSRLSHLFKAALGISTARYIRQLKIWTAQQLLEEGSLTVKEVMARSGFSDRSHFAQEFKKATGLCPSEYREIHISNRFWNPDSPRLSKSVTR